MKQLAYICPLSSEGSNTRKRSDTIMDKYIAPIAKDLGYSVVRADKLSGNNILTDIMRMLHESDLVVADMTELNANVFYELGIRHAIKGKCINIIDSKGFASMDKGLPFDVNYYRAHEYNLKNGKSMSDFPHNLKEAIKKAEEERTNDSILKDLKDKKIISDEEFSDLFNITVVTDSVTTQREHYGYARKILENKKCKKIFLMQRSSSIILGAESGWPEEDAFIGNLRNAIDGCEGFYHIITLEGIEQHLNRRDSIFPEFEKFSEVLCRVDRGVGIKKRLPNDKGFIVKKLPKDASNSLFKLDRQARVLAIEYEDGGCLAVVVQNLGNDQTCFVMKGEKIKDYISRCIDYYYQCDVLEWDELSNLYNSHRQRYAK